MTAAATSIGDGDGDGDGDDVSGGARTPRSTKGRGVALVALLAAACTPPMMPDAGRPDTGYEDEDAGIDAGPPPDYCDIKPILTVSCIGNCHGATMTYPMASTTFRLDYYAPPNAASLPGAKQFAARIDDRIWVRFDMPPFDFPPKPTIPQRRLVHRWFQGGARPGDGGCDP